MSKTITLKPVTGYLDLRSEPEDIPVNGYRYCQNFQVVQKNKLCRSTGWARLMDEEATNNADFHNQLLDITGKPGRKPITFLYEAESTLKTTMLMVGTEDALYQLNAATQNYRVLSANIGGFVQAAQNLDTIVLTNDRDKPMYWVFDTPASGGLSTIPDLEEIGITKVGVVVTFRGVTFYMNVVEKGRTLANRMYWSDLDNALSVLPNAESQAGYLDLESGESILNAKALGNMLLVYTTRGIWSVTLVGGEAVFEASKRYEPGRSSEAVLAYRNTLVGTGDTHVYMGESGIYEYGIFDPKPKLIEWVHRASSVIYDELDQANCMGPVAGFDSERHEIWISWVAQGNTLPTRSLTINTQFPFTSIVDHGFTAFTQFMPRIVSATVRDFLIDTCICTAEEVEEFFGGFDFEGGYCQAPEEVICDDAPDSLFTTVELELEDGIVMEDFNEAEPSANSFCARLQTISDSLADLCVAESQSDQCNASRLFVMASADDYCLKQASDSYYREQCVVFTGCGEYEQRGYKSILRSGPLSFKNVDDEKRLEHFMVEASTVAQLVPSQLKLRVGASKQALDPNVDCGIVWQEQDALDLKCLGGTEASHAANHTRPDAPFEWPLYWIGTNLYYELTVENSRVNPPDTGGAVCFSKYVMEVTPQPVRY
jgi:hypothetical protein